MQNCTWAHNQYCYPRKRSLSGGKYVVFQWKTELEQRYNFDYLVIKITFHQKNFSYFVSLYITVSSGSKCYCNIKKNWPMPEISWSLYWWKISLQYIFLSFDFQLCWNFPSRLSTDSNKDLNFYAAFCNETLKSYAIKEEKINQSILHSFQKKNSKKIPRVKLPCIILNTWMDLQTGLLISPRHG